MDERLAKAIALLREGLNQPVNPAATETTNETRETTMHTTMNATYTRLSNGAWGLRAQGVITPGQQVRVTTRDGRSKFETVGEIVYSNAGVTVATTARAQAAENQPAPAPMPVQPARAAEPVQPDLDQIIRDLETALAGLKSLRRAA